MVTIKSMPKKTRAKKKEIARRKFGSKTAPMDKGFMAFKAYNHQEAERKDIAGVIRKYIRKEYPKEAKILLNAPDYMYYTYPHVSSTISWLEAGLEFPDNYDGIEAINKFIDRLKTLSLQKASNKKEEVKKPQKISRSPMEIVKERSSEFVSEIEEILDQYEDKVTEVSVYSMLEKIDAPYHTGKKVHDYYTPLLNELEELVNDKPEDLVEAYSHMKPIQRKRYMNFVSSIVEDAYKYMNKKKAVRRVSKPKIKTANQQTSKLNYLKDSTELKVSSIDPVKIIGSTRFFMYVTNHKKLVEFVSDNVSGFQIKGSTLLNVDLEKSRCVSLRKPDEILPQIQGGTIPRINKIWKGLTTKTKDMEHSRVNKHCLLLKVFDK